MAQRLNYIELSPDGTGAMRVPEHYLNTASGLEVALLEKVRLRASQINGCTYCTDLHTHELNRHNEAAGRIEQLAVWRTSDVYTQRERAALAWTEAITDIQHGHASDEEYTAVRSHFSEKEVVDLTVAVASINAWNRLAIAFRAERRKPAHSPDSRAPVDHSGDGDGGKVTVEEEG